MRHPATIEGRRKFRVLFALALTLIALHAAWMQTDLGGESLTRHFANVAAFNAAFLAGVACLCSGLRKDAPNRKTWLGFGAAGIVWSLGAAATVWYEVDPGRSSSALSLADIGYLGFVPLACAAALSMAVRPVTAYERTRMVLDVLSVAGVFLFLGWLFTLGPVFKSLDGSMVDRMVTAAYPLGDAVLAGSAILIAMSTRASLRAPRTMFATLGLALTAFLVADTASMMQASEGRLANGNLVDTAFFASFLFLGLASFVPRNADSTGAAHTARVWGQVVPSLGAVAVLTLELTRASAAGALDAISVWLSTTLILLVFVRQIVAVFEEQRLTRLLQARIADRNAALSRREEQFKALVQHSSDVIVIAAVDGSIQYVSPSVRHVLGHTAEELDGHSVFDIVIEGDSARVRALLAMAARRNGASLSAQWRLSRSDGAVRQVEVLVRNLLDEPSVGGIVLNLRDVTERKELEDQLTHQALHDDLTTLPNRARLRMDIERALARWLLQNEPFCLVVVDVDDFKSINDSLGHVAGDAVLKNMATRLGNCIRRTDTLVRLGGDEFAVLLHGLAASDTQAHDIAERVIASISEPMRVEGRVLNLRGSVGLACVTEQVSQADDILRNADLAMHAAKTNRRGGFVQFEVSMHDAVVRRVELEGDLRRAMENDELQLYYQPTVELESGQIEGVEALLRWPHPEKGFISPADFVPIAEESGLIVPLGTWVLRHACNEMAKWQMRYPSETPLILNVNLSGKQLAQPDIVETVASVLAESGLLPNTLVLEMTESVLLDNNPATLAKMKALVGLGVQLAIDDFGTGYSSLSYLRQFPIGVLKVDRSFVNGVGPGGSSEESALVQAILDLANTLKLRTVAEGIETASQFAELRRMGCDVGQGFFLAKPAPAEEVRRLIEQTSAVGKPVPAAATS